MSLWVWVVAAVVGLAGCAGGAGNTRVSESSAAGAAGQAALAEPALSLETAEEVPAYEPYIPDRDAGFARDREAILKMAGGFRVDYRFEETVALRPGVELAPPYTASAVEWIEVAQDTGERVVLQHLLVMGEPARVVKHWQETWDYAPSAVLRYVSENVWEMRELLSPGQIGRWSRTVSEADGSPSYGAWGRWSHGTVEGSGSQWQASTAVLAPPPRREGLRRTAYEVVLVRDAVTLTPDGWRQQQTLAKRWFNPDTPGLARESGVVSYRRIEDDAEFAASFTAARAYWRQVGPFWEEARRAWDERWTAAGGNSGGDSGGGAVRLREEVNGEPRWRRLFALADALSNGGTARPADQPGTTGEWMREQIDAVLADYVLQP